MLEVLIALPPLSSGSLGAFYHYSFHLSHVEGLAKDGVPELSIREGSLNYLITWKDETLHINGIPEILHGLFLR